MAGDVNLAAEAPPRAPRHARSNGGAGVDLGPLEDIAGFMLRICQLRLFEAFFAEFGEAGVRPGEFSLLVAIGRNPGIRQGVLADALMIKWSNMAKLVRQLDIEGLIARSVPKSDRRAVELRLTPAGKATVDRVLPAIRDNDRAATAMLDAAERETLLSLLARIADKGAGEPGRP